MQKIEYLDSWRGIGCFMVFISHILDKLFECGSFFGKSGVAILFALSAYLLCELYYWNEKKIDIKWSINFWKKRAIRIFPPLLFTCFIAVLLRWMTIETAIRQCLMLEQYSHFWVLPLECGFYLLFPIIILLIKKNGKLRSIIIGSIMIIFIWSYYVLSGPMENTSGFIYCLPMFILGIIVSLISHKIKSILGGGQFKRHRYFWGYVGYCL